MSKTLKSMIADTEDVKYMDYLTNFGWQTIGHHMSTGYYSRYSKDGISAANTKETIEAIYDIEIQH